MLANEETENVKNKQRNSKSSTTSLFGIGASIFVDFVGNPEFKRIYEIISPILLWRTENNKTLEEFHSGRPRKMKSTRSKIIKQANKIKHFPVLPVVFLENSVSLTQ